MNLFGAWALAALLCVPLQDPDAVEKAAVLRRLHDLNSRVRWKAVGEAERLDLLEAGPRLIELLADSETAIASSRALEWMEIRVDPDALLSRVHSGEVDFEVAKPLLKRWAGPEQHVELLKAVSDESCPWRTRALDLLGEVRSPLARTLALDWLKDPLHPLRKGAVSYLMDLKAAEAIPILRAWAASSEPHECQTAIRALVDLNARDAGADVLKVVREGTEVHKQIPGCAFSQGFEIFDYRRLIAATDPGLIVATLQGWLKDPDARLRSYGAEFLALIGHAESIPKIGALLKDPHESVREEAIAALGALKARDFLKPILDFADGGSGAAAAALGKLGGPEAVAALMRLSRDRSKENRLSALEGLAETDPEACRAQIIPALEEEKDWHLRRVIEMAGTIKARAAAPILARYLDDPDQHVREYARDALRKIRPHDLADEIARRGQGLKPHERRDTLELACGLGSRPAGEWLLADAFQGKKAALGALNALRAPAAWEKIVSIRVAKEPVSVSFLLREGATRASLEFMPPLTPNRRMRRSIDDPVNWGWATLEEVLASDRVPEVLIDPDTVRIVTRAEAIEFWKQWFSESHR